MLGRSADLPGRAAYARAYGQPSLVPRLQVCLVAFFWPPTRRVMSRIVFVERMMMAM